MDKDEVSKAAKQRGYQLAGELGGGGQAIVYAAEPLGQPGVRRAVRVIDLSNGITQIWYQERRSSRD